MNYFVGSEEKGLSLLTFLKQKSEGAYSTKKLKQAIDAKKCSVNGREIGRAHV